MRLGPGANPRIGEQPDRDQLLQAPPRYGLGPIAAGIIGRGRMYLRLWRWAMARSWYGTAAQSRSRLPCVAARTAITPRRVMPTAWRPHTLTARINQQICPAWIPRRDEAVRYDGKGPRLTAGFEVVIPRLPMAPDRVEDLGLELTKVRRLDPDPGPALKRTKMRKRI